MFAFHDEAELVDQFRCKLDGVESICTSPHVFVDLAPGVHQLAISTSQRSPYAHRR